MIGVEVLVVIVLVLPDLNELGLYLVVVMIALAMSVLIDFCACLVVMVVMVVVMWDLVEFRLQRLGLWLLTHLRRSLVVVVKVEVIMVMWVFGDLVPG